MLKQERGLKALRLPMHWLLILFSTKEEKMKSILSGAPDMQEALKMMKGNTKKCR